MDAASVGARDEKLEEYQLKVERMQRLMEEERLVGESRVRQLMEQNDALRLHLKLAVESLKNPIPAIVDMDHRRTSKSLGVEGTGVSEEQEKQTREVTPEPELGWDEEDEGSVDTNEADAMEMQARMEELLKDLGMFRRKVADDHERFGVGKMMPYGEVTVG